MDGNVYKTENGILQGWQEHFSNLATPGYDEDFDDRCREQVHREMREIVDLYSSHRNSEVSEHISVSQVQEAIATSNKGKAPDCYGVQVEHLLYGAYELLKYLTLLVNGNLHLGKLTDVLKLES